MSELAAPSVELGSAMHRKTGMQEAAAHTARGVVAVERWEVGVKRGIAGRAGPDPQQLRYPGHDNNRAEPCPFNQRPSWQGRQCSRRAPENTSCSHILISRAGYNLQNPSHLILPECQTPEHTFPFRDSIEDLWTSGATGLDTRWGGATQERQILPLPNSPSTSSRDTRQGGSSRSYAGRPGVSGTRYTGDK